MQYKLIKWQLGCQESSWPNKISVQQSARLPWSNLCWYLSIILPSLGPLGMEAFHYSPQTGLIMKDMEHPFLMEGESTTVQERYCRGNFLGYTRWDPWRWWNLLLTDTFPSIPHFHTCHVTQFFTGSCVNSRLIRQMELWKVLALRNVGRDRRQEKQSSLFIPLFNNKRKTERAGVSNSLWGTLQSFLVLGI